MKYVRNTLVTSIAFGALPFVVSACGTAAAPDYTFPARDWVCSSATGEACFTDQPALEEAERTVPLPHALPTTSRTYVVREIMLPVAGGAGGRGGAAGFNLDGIDTHSVPTVPGDCRMEEVDFDSTFEAGISGVDNSLEGFIPTIEMLLDAAMCPGESVTGCLDSTLLEQINTGALILLVEVGQIDDFRFDDHVTVQVALGQLVGGGVPALDGRFLAGGQTFEYAMSPSGEPLLLGPAYSADIFRGRVRLATSALPLSINTGTRQLDLSIVDAEMRFDISETTLTNGVIGGGLPNDDIVAAAAMLRADAAELVRTVVEGAADLRPDPADSARCAALSVGITFEAVAAQVQ